MESSESSAVALVFDPEMERVAVRSGARSEPPRFAVRRGFYPEVRDILDAIRRETGADCVILRCLDAGDVERERPRVYSALADGGALRPAFRWASPSDVRLPEGVSLAEPANPAPQAWQRDPDWRRAATDWVADNLPDSVRQAGWSLAQIRSWAISAVFRVESDAARLYFKASPSYFGAEAALTERVAREFPDISPRVVAADAERGWLLMEDLGDDTLASSAPGAAVWRDAMGALARVQLAYAGSAAALRELRETGIERRPPAAALETLRTWIADPESAEIRVWRGRFEDALKRLEPGVGEIDRMIRRLNALALPETLDHGDLDATNIFVQNGRPILMDWSDAAISPPLFTAAMIRPVSRDPEIADAFMSHWTGFAPLADLRQAFSISKIIAAIDRAAHYRANIVPHLPDGSAELRDLERYIPDLLGLAASALER